MPTNPYPQIATNLTTEESNIIASWGFAENELNSQTAPATCFLEIQWDGAAIIRIFDGSAVSSLSQAEQLRLYPQLGGLFNLAMRNLLYP
jgi:hypothetical protein